MAVVEMDTPVLFVQGLGAHRAGRRQLSTENLEVQLENLGKLDKTPATLLQGNGMHLPAYPDLIPAAIQAKSNLERALQRDILRCDSDGIGRKLKDEPALSLIDFV